MTKNKILLAICAALMLTLSGTAQTKKYAVKSGVITYDQETVLGKMKMHDKIIVSFDDFGMKECKETYKDDALDEVFFSNGKELFVLKPKVKTAYKRGQAYRGTELKFDWNEVSTKDKKEGRAKQLPSRTVAGKTCEAFQHTLGSTTSIFAGWSGITLYSEVKSKGMTITTKAVKIEENASIPSSKFQVPAGFAMQ
jgi:outer membrane lipoprotein-sorting protein